MHEKKEEVRVNLKLETTNYCAGKQKQNREKLHSKLGPGAKVPSVLQIRSI